MVKKSHLAVQDGLLAESEALEPSYFLDLKKHSKTPIYKGLHKSYIY